VRVLCSVAEHAASQLQRERLLLAMAPSAAWRAMLTLHAALGLLSRARASGLLRACAAPALPCLLAAVCPAGRKEGPRGVTQRGWPCSAMQAACARRSAPSPRASSCTARRRSRAHARSSTRRCARRMSELVRWRQRSRSMTGRVRASSRPTMSALRSAHAQTHTSTHAHAACFRSTQMRAHSLLRRGGVRSLSGARKGTAGRGGPLLL
jgi:hypothetical protein